MRWMIEWGNESSPPVPVAIFSGLLFEFVATEWPIKVLVGDGIEEILKSTNGAFAETWKEKLAMRPV